MLSTITAILTIGAEVAQAEPAVLAIVKTAIAAFEAKDQAALDAAHEAARALADSLKP